jgi:hypothetical protein
LKTFFKIDFVYILLRLAALRLLLLREASAALRDDGYDGTGAASAARCRRRPAAAAGR